MLGHYPINSVRGRDDAQLLPNRGCHILEILFALPVALQVRRSTRLGRQQPGIEFNPFLLDVAALLERQAATHRPFEVTAHTGQGLQPLRRRGLAAGDVEVVELVAALVVMVAGKAAHIVEHKFSIVHQRQPAGCCIAEELVAKAAEDAGDDFWMAQLIFNSVCLQIGPQGIS